MSSKAFDKKERDSWICWSCLHHTYVKGKDPIATFEEPNVTIRELIPVHFYCKAGHEKPDFECKDFEPTREGVRDLIINLLGELGEIDNE